MNLRASLIILVLLPSTLIAKESVLLKYEEIPKIIQTQSKDVKAAKILAEASASRQGHVGRSRYPRLDIESGLRGVKEVDGNGKSAPYFRIEGSVSLYRGNRDALKDAVQELETAIRSEDAQLIYRNQLSLARGYYVKLASVREIKQIWAETMKMVVQKKHSVQIKVQAGLTTATGVLEFDLFESSLKREKRTLDKDEHEYSNKLRMALGLDESTSINLDNSFAHPIESNESRYKMGTTSHPEIRKLNLQADQAKAAGQLPKSQWIPEISLFASYDGYLQNDSDLPGPLPARDIAAGIRMSFPLGDSLSQVSESSAKRLEASAFELQKQQHEKEIEMSFHEYLHDMQVLHELIHDSDVQIKKARKYFKQVSEEYERGIKDGTDVLEATRTLYQTELEHVQLRYDYYLAEVGISNLIEL